MLEGEATGLRGLAATEPRALPSSPAPAPSPPPRGPESQPILQQLATLPSHAAPARAPDPRDGGAGLCCPVELDHQSGDLGGAQNQPPASSPHSACVNPPLRVQPRCLGSSPACLATPPPAVPSWARELNTPADHRRPTQPASPRLGTSPSHESPRAPSAHRSKGDSFSPCPHRL